MGPYINELMYVDDRLATVLQYRVTGERTARTAYRQLLDLLGQADGARPTELIREGIAKLDALSDWISATERADILRHSGRRIRSARLIAHLAQDDPAVGLASIQIARLTMSEWEALIPDLPVRARGFLRSRDDLPPEIDRLLDRLGVHDRALPQPQMPDVEPEESEPPEAVERPDVADRSSEISSLVQRIEAFQQARGSGSASRQPTSPTPPVRHFDFTLDLDGRIDWAEDSIAPMVVGTRLEGLGGPLGQAPGPLVAQHLPLRNTRVSWEGADVLTGTWRIDAEPRFSAQSGRFEGYWGRARRVDDSDDRAALRSAADRIRQLLHELRTPVTAIQGFAEVIQQQVFGETPHEYRALAASIAGDSARMLAGFDELDRLSKLESGALELDEGTCDFAAIVQTQHDQLQAVLAARLARLDIASEGPFPLVAAAKADAERLAWRILAAITSSLGAGETVSGRFQPAGPNLSLVVSLPESLAAAADIFSSETRGTTGSISSGIFGIGFALRLARAEATALGGGLQVDDGKLQLDLPIAVPAANDRFSDAVAAAFGRLTT